MDRSNLIDRATEIGDIARSLSAGLAKRGLPEPSFEHGLPAPLQTDAPDSDVLDARVKLLGLLDEMRDLLTDPALLGSPELVSKREYLPTYYRTRFIGYTMSVCIVHSIVTLTKPLAQSIHEHPRLDPSRDL